MIDRYLLAEKELWYMGIVADYSRLMEIVEKYPDATVLWIAEYYQKLQKAFDA